MAAVLMSLFHPERLADLRMQRVNCNNTPAILISGERLEGVFLIEIADGKIINFFTPSATRTNFSRWRPLRQISR
ncbi:hypothetical protein GCM10020254_05510 [Streptomyces goshikiensis]